MRGIVMAGGKGSRLDPISTACNKQLLPVYDKPLIYYPITTLISGGIREILLITTQRDKPNFEYLLKDGSQWGISISYAEEIQPKGIAAAFTIGEDFIGRESVCLILGDNIFSGPVMSDLVTCSSHLTYGAKILGYRVSHPERYGVVEFDSTGQIVGLEEKPERPKSSLVVPGLYFYDHQVVSIAKVLQPSRRGELEITDVNRTYLEQGQLQCEILSNTTAWIDAGTPDALNQSSNYIYYTQKCQGVKIGCPEETAYRKGFITYDQLQALGKQLEKTEYGQYLLHHEKALL